MPFKILFFTNYFWNFRESGSVELTYNGIKNEKVRGAARGRLGGKDGLGWNGY